MPDEFEAVANGSQRRARWRSANGWIRVERLSERHLNVRGPRRELLRLSAAVRNDWVCVCSPADTAAGGDELELMLVRADRHGMPPRRRVLQAGSGRALPQATPLSA